MRLRCGGIFSFTAESSCERILKIDQHLAKLIHRCINCWKVGTVSSCVWRADW